MVGVSVPSPGGAWETRFYEFGCLPHKPTRVIFHYRVISYIMWTRISISRPHKTRARCQAVQRLAAAPRECAPTPTPPPASQRCRPPTETKPACGSPPPSGIQDSTAGAPSTIH